MSTPPSTRAPARIFLWAVTVTVVALAVSAFVGGAGAVSLILVLAVLEVSFSFDNALVNASYLRRLSAFWQRMFLTVGVAVAVFGMRLLFPIAVVCFSTGKGPFTVLRLAAVDKGLYQQALERAQPVIAAFGGVFLLLIFLDFLMTPRDVYWFAPLERLAARYHEHRRIPPIVALAALVLEDLVYNPPNGEGVVLGGTIGALCYLVVGGIGNAVDNHIAADGDSGEEDHADAGGPAVPRPRRAVAVGKAAIALLCYLELIDASFSFDGVIGSFAVTDDIVYIAVGLGIGAVFVRSLTVYFVRQGTLDEFVHLEHGAHYAIGALATMLLMSIGIGIPALVKGLVGVVFILAALGTSLLVRHGWWRTPAEETADEPLLVPTSDADAAEPGPERIRGSVSLAASVVIRYVQEASSVRRSRAAGTADLPTVIYLPSVINSVGGGGAAHAADVPAPHR